ncbi:hypothetical protein EDD15DRAFT_2256173, partial [Pisolithus albus]
CDVIITLLLILVVDAYVRFRADVIGGDLEPHTVRQDRDVCLGEENVEQDKGAIKHEENLGVEVHLIWLLLSPCSRDIIPCE